MSIGKLLATALTVLSLSAPAMAAQQVVINGSTTVLPVVQKAGEAFMASHPDVELSISGGGSGNGIKALIEKQCDIAMSSRDIKEKEVEAAKKNGVTPNRVVVAIDAIVPVVNPANSVAALTTAQLRDIYAGKITNWKEVGGKDLKITLIHRSPSSGSRATIQQLVLKTDKFTDNAVIQDSNGAVRAAIGSTAGAIGYVDAAYADATVKTLAVDGVKYSLADVANGKYKILTFGRMFTKGQPTGATKAFIDFVTSKEFQETYAEKSGFVPITKMPK